MHVFSTDLQFRGELRIAAGPITGDEGQAEGGAGHEPRQGDEESLPSDLQARGRALRRGVVLVGGVVVGDVEVEQVPLVDDLQVSGDHPAGERDQEETPQ